MIILGFLTRQLLSRYAIALVFFLPAFPTSRSVNSAEIVEAVAPADELAIQLGPFDTPRELRRKPRLTTKATIPSRGILEKASRRAGAGPSDKNAHAVTAQYFFQRYRPYLRLDDPQTELQLERVFTDSLKRTHLRYSQYYGGLNVWPAILNVHLDGKGNVDLMNGSYVPTPREINLYPTIEEDDALVMARAKVPDGKQAQVGQRELIVYAPTHGATRLAWKFHLDVAFDARWVVVIDAHNNSLLGIYNNVITLAALTAFSGGPVWDEETFLQASQTAGRRVSASGIDLFGQRRPLNVWQESNGRFYLVDTSKPMFNSTTLNGFIAIFDAAHRTNANSFVLVSSDKQHSGWLPDGVSAAFNLSKTYDYYLNRHGRNSINGQRGNIGAFVRYGVNFNNAGWTDAGGEDILIFGDARRYAGALDIVAHEASGGVSQHAVGFIYQDQSGALTEAFSDIFAESVETYVVGAADWLVGGALAKPLRNMKNPSALEFYPGHRYPSKMSQYVNGPILNNFINRDNGGVHINSGIVNRAFYLLAAGLKGAIGLRAAEKIFYRALTIHLTPNSQFLDARLACIQAAEELYGATSTRVKQVAAAFDAVEIFDDSRLLYERSSWKRALSAGP